MTEMKERTDRTHGRFYFERADNSGNPRADIFDRGVKIATAEDMPAAELIVIVFARWIPRRSGRGGKRAPYFVSAL